MEFRFGLKPVHRADARNQIPEGIGNLNNAGWLKEDCPMDVESFTCPWLQQRDFLIAKSSSGFSPNLETSI